VTIFTENLPHRLTLAVYPNAPKTQWSIPQKSRVSMKEQENGVSAEFDSALGEEMGDDENLATQYVDLDFLLVTFLELIF